MRRAQTFRRFFAIQPFIGLIQRLQHLERRLQNLFRATLRRSRMIFAVLTPVAVNTICCNAIA